MRYFLPVILMLLFVTSMASAANSILYGPIPFAVIELPGTVISAAMGTPAIIPDDPANAINNPASTLMYLAERDNSFYFSVFHGSLFFDNSFSNVQGSYVLHGEKDLLFNVAVQQFTSEAMNGVDSMNKPNSMSVQPKSMIYNFSVAKVLTERITCSLGIKQVSETLVNTSNIVFVDAAMAIRYNSVLLTGMVQNIGPSDKNQKEVIGISLPLSAFLVSYQLSMYQVNPTVRNNLGIMYSTDNRAFSLYSGIDLTDPANRFNAGFHILLNDRIGFDYTYYNHSFLQNQHFISLNLTY
ncbi:MAG: hypothetical protein ABIH39_08800 [Candidatus Margulisiibacteriota bacterium]